MSASTIGSAPPPTPKRNRFLGLLTAVGFSVAMWGFIGFAVLGLVLKVAGHHAS